MYSCEQRDNLSFTVTLGLVLSITLEDPHLRHRSFATTGVIFQLHLSYFCNPGCDIHSSTERVPHLGRRVLHSSRRRGDIRLHRARRPYSEGPRGSARLYVNKVLDFALEASLQAHFFHRGGADHRHPSHLRPALRGRSSRARPLTEEGGIHLPAYL